MTAYTDAELERNFQPVTHVIFDLDGLLLNTEIFYTQILNEYCLKFGKQFSWEVKQLQMGRKEHEAALVAIEALGLPVSVDEYVQHVREELTRLLPTSQFLPGAVKLVQHLHKYGCTLVHVIKTKPQNLVLESWETIGTSTVQLF